MEELFETKSYYTEQYAIITDQIWGTQDQNKRTELRKIRNLLKSDEVYTPDGLEIKKKLEAISNKYSTAKSEYIASVQNVYTYRLLYRFAEKSRREPKDLEFTESVFPLFEKEFPNHPYTQEIKDIIDAVNTIKIGGHFVDFSAPTIDGEVIKLSDMIEGKVALIDLWSTWCGPCIVFNRSLIPVYEKYENKGFIVVGVAGLYNSFDDFEKAIERDNYPWLNLIEMNNERGIWKKYGKASAGGGIFLVDTSGIFIEIDPSIEKVEERLNNLLN